MQILDNWKCLCRVWNWYAVDEELPNDGKQDPSYQFTHFMLGDKCLSTEFFKFPSWEICWIFSSFRINESYIRHGELRWNDVCVAVNMSYVKLHVPLSSHPDNIDEFMFCDPSDEFVFNELTNWNRFYSLPFFCCLQPDGNFSSSMLISLSLAHIKAFWCHVPGNRQKHCVVIFANASFNDEREIITFKCIRAIKNHISGTRPTITICKFACRSGKFL